MSNFNKIINILSLIVMVVQIFVIMFYVNKISNYVIYLDICCVIIYCIITCSNLKLCKKLSIFKNSVDYLGKCNNNLTKANENIRAFKHDFNNIMQAIGGYIKLNDFEGLKEYYSDLVFECKWGKLVTTATPTIINDTKMYNIIIEKCELAKNMNITFEFVSFIDFRVLENLNINVQEIIRVLLDNAIKISENSMKTEIILDCLYDLLTNKYVIVVTTFYKNLNEQLFLKKESLINTKVYNCMMKNIEKSKILDLHIDFNENVLIQELDVKLNE